MIRVSILLTIIISVFSCKAPMSKGLQQAQQYQEELAASWLDPQKTPLKEDERQGFKGITFFPLNEDYIAEAVFENIFMGRVLPFPTSANKTKFYVEYGKVRFLLEGKEYQLTVYQSFPVIEGHEQSLFLPFKDKTSGITSYGSGRYLDLDTRDIKNGRITIDFNKAYNPYCAYSKYYNCPMTPANNVLDTEIKAGVSFPDSKEH